MKTCFVAFAIAGSAAAYAQFSDNFEALTGSAGGTLITGQGGWYLAPVAGSTDGNVHTYAGNSLGLAAHPSGGTKFASGVSPAGGANSVRMQHAVSFTNTGTWTLSIDFNFNFSGVAPVQNNLGSVSLQPSATNNALQTLYSYADVNNPTGYQATFGVAGAAGGALVLGTPPAPEWTNLVFNNWYRQTVVWDGPTNRITATTIQNLTAGGPVTTFNPTDWYLTGGANNVLGQALATDVRLFVSGSNANSTNFGGYDNLSIVPEPASMIGLTLGALALLRRRRS